MNISMIDTRLTNFSALGKFLNGVPDIHFSNSSKKDKYDWVKEVFNRFDFRHLKKGGEESLGNICKK